MEYQDGNENDFHSEFYQSLMDDLELADPNVGDRSDEHTASADKERKEIEGNMPVRSTVANPLLKRVEETRISVKSVLDGPLAQRKIGLLKTLDLPLTADLKEGDRLNDEFDLSLRIAQLREDQIFELESALDTHQMIVQAREFAASVPPHFVHASIIAQTLLASQMTDVQFETKLAPVALKLGNWHVEQFVSILVGGDVNDLDLEHYKDVVLEGIRETYRSSLKQHDKIIDFRPERVGNKRQMDESADIEEHKDGVNSSHSQTKTFHTASSIQDILDVKSIPKWSQSDSIYDQVDAAATIIQSIYRGIKYRRGLRQIKVILNCTKLQRWWRRKRKVITSFEHLLELRSLQSNQYISSLVVVQSVIRGYQVRKRAAMALQTEYMVQQLLVEQSKHFSAAVIQCAFRAFAVRSKYSSLRSAAICIQAHARGHLSRKHNIEDTLLVHTLIATKLKEEEEEEVLHGLFRRICFLEEEQLAEAQARLALIRKATVSSATRRIQVFWRNVRWIRKQILLLQRVWRGHLMRLDLRMWHAYAGIIQKCWRAYFAKLAQNRIAIQRQLFCKSQNIISRFVANDNIKRVIKAQLIVRRWSRRRFIVRIVTIQSVARTFLVRCKFFHAHVQMMQLMGRHRHSIVRLQAIVRQRRVRLYFRVCLYMIRRIQRAYRTHRFRCYLTKLASYSNYLKRVLRIQRVFRTYRFRTVFVRRLLTHGACIIRVKRIQLAFRRRRFRDCVRRLMQRQLRRRSATLIQRLYKRFRFFRFALKLLACGRRIKMAKKLQNFIRKRRFRKIVSWWMYNQLRNRMAGKIQCFFRKWLFRHSVCLVLSIRRSRKAVQILERTYIHYKFRASVNELMLRLKQLRDFFQRCYHRRNFLIFRSKIIVLQAYVRMVFTQLSFSKVTQAAVRLQNCFRCQSCKARLIALKKSAIIVQKNYRKVRVRNQLEQDGVLRQMIHEQRKLMAVRRIEKQHGEEVLKEQVQRKAAQTIQQYFRRFRLHQYVHKISLVQATFRKCLSNMALWKLHPIRSCYCCSYTVPGVILKRFKVSSKSSSVNRPEMIDVYLLDGVLLRGISSQEIQPAGECSAVYCHSKNCPRYTMKELRKISPLVLVKIESTSFFFLMIRYSRISENLFNITVFQACIRRYLNSKKYQYTRGKIILLQSHIRGWQSRCRIWESLELATGLNGQIENIHSKVSWDILLDDGEIIEQVDPSALTLLEKQIPLKKGTRVEATVNDWKSFFAAVIVGVEWNGQYKIKFDDENVVTRFVSAENLRILFPDPFPFAVGEIVEYSADRWSRRIRCTVSSCAPGGLYTLGYIVRAGKPSVCFKKDIAPVFIRRPLLVCEGMEVQIQYTFRGRLYIRAIIARVNKERQTCDVYFKESWSVNRNADRFRVDNVPWSQIRNIPVQCFSQGTKVVVAPDEESIGSTSPAFGIVKGISKTKMTYTIQFESGHYGYRISRSRVSLPFIHSRKPEKFDRIVFYPFKVKNTRIFEYVLRRKRCVSQSCIRVRAVIIIQAFYRSKNVQKLVSRMFRSLTKLQQKCRRFLSSIRWNRRRAAKLLIASRLQRAFRGYKSRQASITKTKEYLSTVCRVARRTNLLRAQMEHRFLRQKSKLLKLVPALLNKRLRTAVQTWRVETIRMKNRSAKIDNELNVRILSLCMLRIKKKTPLHILQSVLRMCVPRMIFLRVRNACVLLQSNWRGHRYRLDLHNYILLDKNRKRVELLVQRRILKSMVRTEQKILAAKVVQSSWRSYKTRENTRNAKKEFSTMSYHRPRFGLASVLNQLCATIRLQAWFRGLLSRLNNVKLLNKYVRVECRSHVQRLNQLGSIRDLSAIVVKLQTWFRELYCMSRFKQILFLSVSLQSFYRRRKVRKIFKEHTEKCLRRKSAIKLQSMWRGHIARQYLWLDCVGAENMQYEGFFPARIIQEIDGFSFLITYEHGGFETVKATQIRPCLYEHFQVGSRCEATTCRWGDYLSGTVEGTNIDNTYRVRFDDGEIAESLTVEQLRKECTFDVPYRLGDLVEVTDHHWETRKIGFILEISQSKRGAKFKVKLKFSNKIVSDLPKYQVRPHIPFYDGCRVECTTTRWNGSYFEGTMMNFNPTTGQYHVLFDDLEYLHFSRLQDVRMRHLRSYKIGDIVAVRLHNNSLDHSVAVISKVRPRGLYELRSMAGKQLGEICRADVLFRLSSNWQRMDQVMVKMNGVDFFSTLRFNRQRFTRNASIQSSQIKLLYLLRLWRKKRVQKNLYQCAAVTCQCAWRSFAAKGVVQRIKNNLFERKAVPLKPKEDKTDLNKNKTVDVAMRELKEVTPRLTPRRFCGERKKIKGIRGVAGSKSFESDEVTTNPGVMSSPRKGDEATILARDDEAPVIEKAETLREDYEIFLSHIWEMFDEDREGVLYPKGVQKLLKHFTGHDTAFDDCKEFVKQIDSDESGCISRGELASFIAYGMHMTPEQRQEYALRGELQNTVIEFFNGFDAELQKFQSVGEIAVNDNDKTKAKIREGKSRVFKKAKHFSKFLNSIFDEFDEDRSGDLGLDEMKKLIRKYARHALVTDVEVRKFIDHLDKDDTGTVDRDELAMFLSTGTYLSAHQRKRYASRSAFHQTVIDFFDGIDNARKRFKKTEI